MKLLLTGFEPFGGHAVNPSERLVGLFDGQRVGEVEIVGAVLPVSRAGGPAALLDALARERPDAVIALGLAAGRRVIALERVALNLMDYGIPDNEGELVSDLPVRAEGPAAYFATLPLRAMAEAIGALGIPVELSLSAGAYLCNQVLYELLHHDTARGLSRPAGFIHLPDLAAEEADARPHDDPAAWRAALPHAAPAPSGMTLAMMATALGAAIGTLDAGRGG